MKEKTIEAVRIDIDNLHDVFMFCNAHIRFSPFKQQHYLIDDNKFLNHGDYIIKINDDRFRIIDKEIFESLWDFEMNVKIINWKE